MATKHVQSMLMFCSNIYLNPKPRRSITFYIYNNISIQKKTKKRSPSARVLKANEEDEFNLKEEHPPFLLLGRRRSPPP